MDCSWIKVVLEQNSFARFDGHVLIMGKGKRNPEEVVAGGFRHVANNSRDANFCQTCQKRQKRRFRSSELNRYLSLYSNLVPNDGHFECLDEKCEFISTEFARMKKHFEEVHYCTRHNRLCRLTHNHWLEVVSWFSVIMSQLLTNVLTFMLICIAITLSNSKTDLKYLAWYIVQMLNHLNLPTIFLQICDTPSPPSPALLNQMSFNLDRHPNF